jgi:hypothetical protein
MLTQRTPSKIIIIFKIAKSSRYKNQLLVSSQINKNNNRPNSVKNSPSQKEQSPFDEHPDQKEVAVAMMNSLMSGTTKMNLMTILKEVSKVKRTISDEQKYLTCGDMSSPPV